MHSSIKLPFFNKHHSNSEVWRWHHHTEYASRGTGHCIKNNGQIDGGKYRERPLKPNSVCNKNKTLGETFPFSSLMISNIRPRKHGSLNNKRMNALATSKSRFQSNLESVVLFERLKLYNFGSNWPGKSPTKMGRTLHQQTCNLSGSTTY